MTKKEKMARRLELWSEFQEGMKNDEPVEIFDNRLLDAYNDKVFTKKEFIDLMNEITEIRKKSV